MVQFRIRINKASYFPGEVINGVVDVTLQETIKFRELVLAFAGNGYCRWSSGALENVTTYQNSEKYFEEECVLIEALPNTDDNFLGSGISSFPFRFHLPDNIPSSFDFSVCGDIAVVRHSITVSFKKATGLVKSKQIQKKFYFKVTSFQIDSNFIPCLPEPADAKNEKFLCCLWCQSGPIVVRLRLKKDVFNAGMSIVFDAELDNRATNKTLGKVRVKLVKKIVLLDGKGNEAKYSYPMSSLVLSQSFLPGGDESWHDVRLNTSSLLAPTLVNSLCVNLTYTLAIKVGIPGGISAKTELPVRIFPPVPLTQQVMSSSPSPTALPSYAMACMTSSLTNPTYEQSSSWPILTQPELFEPPPPYPGGDDLTHSQGETSL